MPSFDIYFLEAFTLKGGETFTSLPLGPFAIRKAPRPFMRTLTTLLLFLLVGGLVFFVAKYEHKLPGTKEAAARMGKPFQFDPESVDLIQIEGKDKPLKLQKKDGVWMVVSPLNDRANPDQIKKMVDSVANLEWMETFKRKDMERDDYRRTGLTAAVEVRLLSGTKELAHCMVGTKGAIEDAFYITLPDEKSEDQVHLARTELSTLAHKTPDEWRDDRLVRLKVETIKRFSISAGNGIIEFARAAGGSWQLAKPLQTRASDERVNAVVAAVLNLKVSPGTDADPPVTSTANRTLPPMKILVEAAGEPKPVEITLHSDPDSTEKVEAEASTREGTFLVTAKTRDLWKLQPNHLRDQHLAQINVEATTALRIRSQRFGEVVMSRQAETWMLKRFGQEEAANQERVQQLFDKLNIEQVREFTTDAAANIAPYGLEDPFLELEWVSADVTSKLQFGSGAEGAVYARYANEPFIYRVNPLLFSAIPPDNTRWRSLKVINASLFAVRRILISKGDAPAMSLIYQPNDASWTATVAEQDVTPQLDKAKANQLLEKLVGFTVIDWSSDRTAAYTALKNPSLTVQILLDDPGKQDSVLKPIVLMFAPTVPGQDTGVYHGRIEGEPDTFLISRDQYHEILAPLLK